MCYLLVSSLLLSFMPRCRLVFLSVCKCRIIFWRKTSSFNLSVPLLDQFLKLCSILLFNVLGTLPGQLFLDTLLETCLSEPCLGTCSWEPVLGTLFLGTCSWEHCLVTCSWELSLGNLSLKTLPACFKPVRWDLAREPVFRNFAWKPCLGTCPSEPYLGFCSCFQPCLQMFFEISLCKLFLESCSWEHEQPETMLGNLFVGTVLATYCSKPS